MKTFVSFIFLLAVTLLISVNTQAHDEAHHHATESYFLEDARIKPTLPGATNTAAYFTLVNTSEEAVTMVGVISDIAQIVELHEHLMTGGLMKMQKIESITIEAGESLELAPGGYHIMFINVNRPLVRGGSVPFTLLLDNGNRIDVNARIMDLPTGKPVKHDHY